MTSITEDTARSEYVAGLRALADLLEQQPDLRFDNWPREIGICAGNRDEMVAWIKVLDSVTEQPSKLPDPAGLHYVKGTFRGLKFRIFARAEALGGTKRTVTQRVTEYSVPSLLAEATR